MAAETKKDYKWQPVVLIIDKRLECGRCGAMAVFVEVDTEGEEETLGYTGYCQPCFVKYQEED